MRKINKFLQLFFFWVLAVPLVVTSCGVIGMNRYGPSPKCLLNGSLDSSNGDFDYYLLDGGDSYAVALKESSKSTSGSIEIPSTYKELPVTGIWQGGFYDSKRTSVVIPESITVIDYEAFMNCSIKTITIPASVTLIGEAAFYSCKDLTKVVIKNSTTTSDASSACSCAEEEEATGEREYSELKEIPGFCFFNCVGLKELVLPQSIEEIGREAFHDCIALFSTLAFMNIKAIRSRAFQGCRALKKVYISDTFFEKEDGVPIGVIEDKAFDGCNTNLEFYLVGNETDVNAWMDLDRSLNWNRKSEFRSPGEQISVDETSDNRYTFHITAAGASYTNDWIYTVGQNHDVEISSYIGPTEIEDEPVTFLTVPNELPNGSGNYVRSIMVNAFDSVKENLVRLYLPTTLKRIEPNMFGESYTNLIVIDDNAGGDCASDSTIVENEGVPTARIDLSGLTALEVIGNNAFVNMKKCTSIAELHLPYSLKAVGSCAFGAKNKVMSGVTDFQWNYDANKSELKVIGKYAFYKLGNDVSGADEDIFGGRHCSYLNIYGAENYKLTTLIFPRTFAHFGITSTDNTTYNLGGNDADDDDFGAAAFAGCPLLKKVVFKGSSNKNNTCDLVIPSFTFACEESMRTIVFEERNERCIVFHTAGGQYRPAVGWSAGKNENDFSGDPAIQTIVLPNKNTKLRIQNFAFQGNSRGVIYLSGPLSNNEKIKGSTTAKATASISKPSDNISDLSSDTYKQWRSIGDESYYDSAKAYPGYCFSSDAKSPEPTQNHFGIDQKMPVYENVLYKDPEVDGVTVGAENTTKYAEVDKCAFVCSGSTATMTKYLFDRHDRAFTGEAKVPATITVDATTYTVNTIGDSAFSAAYCDNTNYTNYTEYKNLTSVSLPDAIRTIGEYAFMRAYGITNVSSYNTSTGVTNGNYVMPSSLTSIGKHAFAFCNIEQILKIPDGCVFYENSHDTTYETSVFSNNFALRKITFGPSGSPSSTNYTTTTYTCYGSSTVYTSALYSKSDVTYNKSSLLLVLNRDALDYHVESDDVSVTTVDEIKNSELNGQHVGKYLYGAFKMCYWIDSLVVGTSANSLNQPLISGLNQEIFLNKAYDFKSKTCNLKSISFGSATTIATPPYSFQGCEQLVSVKLPQVEGATIPAGLFASVENEDIIFTVPANETASEWKECEKGELDLTYTKYSGIDAEAFKNTKIKKIIAPITSAFTVGDDAFGSCDFLEEFDVSNVTGTVTFNGSFKGSKIGSSLFKFVPDSGDAPLIRFGKETFKNCDFTDGSFEFPVKTALIGDSCFESSNIQTVTAAGDLVHLEKVVVDNESGQNNVGNNTGFRQIGDYAFYLCKNLTNFDFAHFTELERIGHFAFSMNNTVDANGTIVPDKDGNFGASNLATICEDGVVNLPASLTNLGVGAFYSSKITSVTINSSTIKFERAGSYTSSPRTNMTQKGGFQFRFCSDLTMVYFSNPGCAWTTPYLTKGQNGQDNYFSNCAKLLIVNLPTGYNIQYTGYTGDENNQRPDSMVWASNNNLKFYLHHTLSEYYNFNLDVPSKYWRRVSDNSVKDLVYYVHNSGDVSKLENNNYVALLSGAQFWTLINGTPTYLGTVTTIDPSNGNVTFSVTGYSANSGGVVHSA